MSEATSTTGASSGRAEPGREFEPLSARTALVHDWFQGFHGAERVADSMLDVFAETPDIFTFSAAKELLPERLAGAIRQQSKLARLPGIRQRGHDPGRWRWLLPYMPRYFEQLDLSGHDLVLSSAWACAAGVKKPPSAFHAVYCYTPMRYVWMPETDRDRVTGLKGAALKTVEGRLRRWDLAASQRSDLYIAISTAVAERIGEFYGRNAEVIFPPVALAEFSATAKKEPGHFLWVHRLVPYKRPLEVAAAFAQLPHLKLTMVGIGPLEAELRAALPPNVSWQGWTDREQLAALYSQASGFIHVGEEDFGITMVEALAAGTPVLAIDRGGARDIVEDGVDGVVISDPQDSEQLIEGIERLAAGEWDAGTLRKRAERFSESRFQRELAATLRGHGVS